MGPGIGFLICFSQLGRPSRPPGCCTAADWAAPVVRNHTKSTPGPRPGIPELGLAGTPYSLIEITLVSLTRHLGRHFLVCVYVCVCACVQQDTGMFVVILALEFNGRARLRADSAFGAAALRGMALPGTHVRESLWISGFEPKWLCKIG